jgi:hypothetical protein
MEFLDKMREIHSFVELQEIYESWINEGVIEEKALELGLSYASLIAYPSIYLTKNGAEQEIASAKLCHEILMKYAKDDIKNMLNSDNNAKLSAALLMMPPEKYILTVCSEFFNLNNFLKGLYPNFTDQQLANINGDDYAKVWLNIFSKGYHFEQTEQALKTDFNHLNESSITISKMQLSTQYKEKMNVETIKPQFKKYYHEDSNDNSGTGCMVLIMLFLISSAVVACSI